MDILSFGHHSKFRERIRKVKCDFSTVVAEFGRGVLVITGSVKVAAVWDWLLGSDAERHTLSKLQAGGL
jgi:hypothetical protein